VRVTAQLIHAGTELSVWTSAFEREIADLIALQREVARTVAAGLKVRLTPQQEQRLAAAKRADPAAVEAYLKGRYQWYKRTPDSLRTSIGLYEEAINRDPGYASAYAGLSAAYVLLGGLVIGATPSAESLPKARDAATRALQLDPDLADAHAALAYTQLYLWDVAGSGLSFQRALSINPNDATTRFWNGVRLAAEGRFDEAIAEAVRARELDPVSPIITAGESWMNHFARRHARAAELASAALAIEPDFVIGHARLGAAERYLGDFAKSLNALEHALSLSPDIPDQLAQLGQTYAQQGNRAAALQTLARLSALAKTRYVPAFDLALVHAALGDRDEAFRWLRRAVDERYGPLIFLEVEPDVDALRSDPRLAAIVAEVKRGSAKR
jgi:tetratricopeptide (TPR) repeat protein